MAKRSKCMDAKEYDRKADSIRNANSSLCERARMMDALNRVWLRGLKQQALDNYTRLFK